MKYFSIDHFFDESDANERFEKLIEDYGFKEEENKNFLRYALKDEFWIALQKTIDTTTLIADLQVISKNFFTIIEYEYAEDFSFKVQEVLPNRFKLTFREEEEDKYSGLIHKLIDFSNFAFLIQRFHERSSEAFEEVNRIDEEIADKYKWRIPKNFGEEFLSELERLLDVCGRNYSKIEANYHLALTHLKNVREVVKKVGLEIDLSPIRRLIEEMRFNLKSSETIYERIKDMKDITLGNVEIRGMKSSMRLQEEMLGLQKYAMTIRHASIIIEAFIVYATTLQVWSAVNAEGFKVASLLMKYVTPLFITLGVVLFVEFLKDLKIGIAKRSVISLLLSIILIASGIYLMSM